MESMNLMPVDTGSSIGGPTLGAFGGALVGSWLGDGGFGRRNDGYGAGAPAAVVTNAIDTSMIMDNLTSIQSGLNDTNINVLQSTNQLAQGLCNIGFQDSQNTASIINATNQGFSGLNTAIQNSGFESRLATTSGLAGLTSAVQTNGFESRLATQDLGFKLAECCCETQKTIISEGQATRALMDKYAYEALQTQLCDAKSKISTLESNAFTSASNAQQTQVILQHLGCYGK